MGQFTQDGVIYEETGNGQVRVVGYADTPSPAPGQNGGIVIGTPRQADPVEQARERAQLENQIGDNARANALAPLQQQLLTAQVASARAAADRAAREAANPAPPNLTNAQIAMGRRGNNLRALSSGLDNIQGLYERNFQDGWPNGIVGMLPDLIRPENGHSI